MALNVSRLRKWVAASAMVLLAVVAGFYIYGRMRLGRALKTAPQRLGIDIQQSTQGFTFSRSEKGRTLFTVHASSAIQYKEGGRAALRDVSIVVYGPRSNRFDQIYGSDFEYDPQSGDISARGEVHIDLQGNAEGPVAPDQAQPQELKNPIHLKTSGLVFNQKSGLAQTREKIEFRVPQADGEASGAVYDSRAGTLTLVSDVHVRAAPPNTEDIRARHGVISKGPERAVLDEVRMERVGSTFQAERLTMYFREDNTVERMTADGEVQAEGRGRSNVKVAASQVDVSLTGHNRVRTAVLSGGVNWEAEGENKMSGRAGEVTLDFAAGNVLQKITASQKVTLTERPKAGASPQAHTVEVMADAMDFFVQQGRTLERAVTSGPAQVAVVSPQAGASERTVATAGQFEASFDNQNRLQQVVGTPDVRVVSSSAGQPDRISTSRRLEVALNAEGGISSLEQEGDFHYQEVGSAAEAGGAPAMAGERNRAAWANRGRYTPADENLVLAGSPRITEGGMTTTAERVVLNRRSGEAVAEGEVKTTYSELKPEAGVGPLATSEPIHVTAQSMRARQAGGTAIYSGGARLWQGANTVQAPLIEFDRIHRTVVARGSDGTPTHGANRVSTVFVERDKAGKTIPINVTARRLTYSGAESKASFDGEVMVRGGDGSITARQMDIYLQSSDQSKTAPSSPSATPSQVERVVARGSVVLQQPQRRATGEQLTYVIATGTFTLTGGPPSIFDAEHGKTTGDSLTFYSRDDRVLVESKGMVPTVTQTRVTK